MKVWCSDYVIESLKYRLRVRLREFESMIWMLIFFADVVSSQKRCFDDVPEAHISLQATLGGEDVRLDVSIVSSQFLTNSLAQY